MKYIKLKNYCTLVPDGLFGVRFNYACYLHDRQYRNEVKNRLNRKGADKQLRNEIYKIYTKKNKKFIGYFVSRIYYLGVRIFGGKSWEKH